MKNLISKIILGGLLAGLPLLATVEVKADDHLEMPSSETEEAPMSDPMQSPVYNSTDGGADGEPVTTIDPSQGTIAVMMKNETNAAIDYQAIGYTENQTLEAGEEHTMTELPVPVVIRSARQDDGFIKILPLTEEDGMLVVTLEEDPEFYDDENLGVLSIEEDGSVYVN